MILKIDTNKRKNDCLEYDEYWIYGEIERIHYKYLSPGGVPGGRTINKECYDLILFYDEEDPEKKLLQIILRFSDIKRDVYNILLQGCTCYLCNNDGKTIDKLTC